jgi:hypothetical protein
VSTEDEWLKKWHLLGYRVRYILSWPQIIIFATSAFASLITSLDTAFSTPTLFSTHDIATISDKRVWYANWHYTICVIGLLGHMGLFVGYFWLSHGRRNLPYWGLRLKLGNQKYPILSLQPISSFLFKHQWLNNLLVVIFILVMATSLFNWHKFLLLPAVMLLGLLCLLDLWRLFYHHYYLLSLAAFLFPLPQISIQIILASTYFWSGFGKVTMPEFYRSVAPAVFSPLAKLLSFCISTFRLSSIISVRGQRTLFNLVVGIGVAMEMMMGLVFFFPTQAPPFLLYATLVFNFFMHCYIIVFIGLGHNMHAFISWNTWCALLTQQLFSPAFERGGLYYLSNSWDAFHWFTFLAMTLPPLLMLFGKCPHAGLSHSHFAPGWYGTSTLFLPTKARDRIPRRVNGQELPYYTYNHNIEGFEELFERFCHARRHNTENSTSGSRRIPLAEEGGFKERWVVLGEEWYLCTFNYGEGDPCQLFSPAPPSFWESVVGELMPEYMNGGGALLLMHSEFSVLHRSLYTALIPL